MRGETYSLATHIGRLSITAVHNGMSTGLRTRAGPGYALLRSLLEEPPLDLPPVVLQGVVEVDGGRPGRLLGFAVTDRPVDRVVLFDRARGVAADRAGHPDDVRLALQAAGFAHGRDEELVVGRGGDAEVEVVVAAVEQRALAGQVTVAARLGGGLDRAQFGRGGVRGRQPTGGGLLDPAELEEHVDVVEV